MGTKTNSTESESSPAIDRITNGSSSVEIVLLHDHYSDKHLAEVMDEMRTLGTPVLRAIWSEGHGCWYALEGCHRLRAAHSLGLMPMIVAVDEDDEISEDTGYDLADAMTGEQIIDGNVNNKSLWFSR